MEAHPEVREKVRHDLLTPESVEARPKLEQEVEQVDELALVGIAAAVGLVPVHGTISSAG